MNVTGMMTTMTTGMTNQTVINAFHEAALFLIDRIENDGWKKWSWNYLREHVRCKTGLEFANAISPEIYKILRRQHPEIGYFADRQGDFFSE